jgi:predicted acylesterase/phospholipase RssA
MCTIDVGKLGRRRKAIWACAALLLAGAPCGCARSVRQELDEAKLLELKRDYLEQASRENIAQIDRIVERLKRQHDEAQAGGRKSETYDVLVISGGGDYGAFGAGFLKGWASVEEEAWRTPEFDLVTGVSTGALIAPFAFVGDEESLESIDRIYQEPKDDWVLLRGLLFFLPGNPSLLNNDGLRRDIEERVNDEFIERMARAADGGRACDISATNLDFGVRRVWDIGHEAQEVRAGRSTPARLRDMLLASSAIPAAFPPVEIDGHLYCDGAVTSNILYNANMRSASSVLYRWHARYPNLRLPRIRFWVIINAQLEQIPRTVQPNWLDVTAAAAETIVRSATAQAIELLARELALIEAAGVTDVEFRVASIPSSWRPPTSGLFQKETMESLAKLGEDLGGKPSEAWVAGTAMPQPIGPAGTPGKPVTPPQQERLKAAPPNN